MVLCLTLNLQSITIILSQVSSDLFLFFLSGERIRVKNPEFLVKFLAAISAMSSVSADVLGFCLIEFNDEVDDGRENFLVS